ncbi:DUF6602 domain-containing protein [Insolitispirillum peregrinum]|uniref:DUF6602 domain-containing protein n=1 Tax=Insolitispirillum peregrinum TaxID=80876 RepID=UPI003612E2CA
MSTDIDWMFHQNSKHEGHRNRAGKRNKMAVKEWDLPSIFKAIHDDIVLDLETSRCNLKHPGDKGDASEQVWIDLLNNYLPRRYQVTKGHVVDSKGKISDQIDLIIFDRQYSPFIFKFKNKTFIPAESVYAVFEVKQVLNNKYIKYAREKIASVRTLHRTSIPVKTVDGERPPKELHTIIGGFLALESDSKKDDHAKLKKRLSTDDRLEIINIGCIAKSVSFSINSETFECSIKSHEAIVTDFLMDLTKQLQGIATVPALDIDAYRKWTNPIEE